MCYHLFLGNDIHLFCSFRLLLFTSWKGSIFKIRCGLLTQGSRYIVIKNQHDTDIKIVLFGLQGIMWPQVITGLAGNVLNILINYIFLFPLELGVA